MKRLLLSAALLALAAPAIAAPSAPPATGNVTVDGSVAVRCQFTLGNAAIVIPELAKADGTFDPSTVDNQAKDLTGWCNGANSSMTVNATSMLNASAAPTGFSNQVDFAATATAGSASANDTNSTDGLDGSPVKVGVFNGTIHVVLSASSSHGGSTLKMVAGPYAGNVLVTLSPAA